MCGARHSEAGTQLIGKASRERLQTSEFTPQALPHGPPPGLRPFDDPDFLYEVKFDGFRALAYVNDGHCELVSRKMEPRKCSRT